MITPKLPVPVVRPITPPRPGSYQVEVPQAPAAAKRTRTPRPAPRPAAPPHKPSLVGAAKGAGIGAGVGLAFGAVMVTGGAALPAVAILGFMGGLGAAIGALRGFLGPAVEIR